MTKDELLASMPGPLREIMDKVLSEEDRRITHWLAMQADAIAKCDATEVIYVSMTRVSGGLTPHPQLLIAAMKIMNEVLLWRSTATTGQALHHGKHIFVRIEQTRDHPCPRDQMEHEPIHDAQWCRACDQWLEPPCSDPNCCRCKDRPARPSMVQS